MKCPFGPMPKDTCANTDCVFASKINKSNCFFGESSDIQNVAFHKGISVRLLKTQLAVVDEKVYYTIRLLKYAEFCTDENPTEYDLRMFAKLKDAKPYTSRLFNFVTPNRFARMNRLDAFEAFQKTGMILEDNLKDFLLKPIKTLNLQ
jgi:hypothetical protein